MNTSKELALVAIAALVAFCGHGQRTQGPRSAAARRLASRRGSSSSPMKRGQGASAPPPSQPSWRRTIRPRPSRPTAAREASGLSLDQFLAKRGGSAIVARGRTLKQSHAALFASIEQRYGVPPGPLLAIWGMETAFGRQRGNQHTLSAVATLAYDCRRSAFFTDQLYAALTLIDRGDPLGRHARLHARRDRPDPVPAQEHPELRHRRKSRQRGQRAGLDGELPQGPWLARGRGIPARRSQFRAIQAWNAAPVYQRAIAIIGQRIDGNEGLSARR